MTGETKTVSVSTLSKGSYILIEGVPCRVLDIQISKTGKHGHSKARLTAIGLIDEKKRVAVMPGHENVEVPIVEKKIAQVLSITGDRANVMDAESFETFDLQIPEELKGQMREGVNIVYWIIINQRVMKQVKGAAE